MPTSWTGTRSALLLSGESEVPSNQELKQKKKKKKTAGVCVFEIVSES